MDYPESKYKIATGFGSGLGESGCSCGSLTAGVMVLSLIAGRNHVYESERVAYTAVHELHQRFKEKHKAICCRILTRNVEWGTAEHKILCETYVIDAAQITEDLIHSNLLEYVRR